MNVIVSLSHNCAFNLALEEYLFSEHDRLGDICLLYVNSPCFVVGKSQNVYQELKWLEVEKLGVPIYRRNSGGGTVYHDLYNLNYSFIVKRHSDNVLNFKKFLAPIMEFLHNLSVEAEYFAESDIYLEGKKISGNAQMIRGTAVMHHGTLLFASDLSTIDSLLTGKSKNYSSKAVASRRSAVTNIQSYLKRMGTDMNFDEFVHCLSVHLLGLDFSGKSHGEDRIFKLSESCEEISDFAQFVNASNTFDIKTQINQLITSKYLTFDWNYGKSPIFEYHKMLYNQDIYFRARKGVIEEFNITNAVEILEFEQWQTALNSDYELNKNVCINKIVCTSTNKNMKAQQTINIDLQKIFKILTSSTGRLKLKDIFQGLELIYSELYQKLSKNDMIKLEQFEIDFLLSYIFEMEEL